jgi:hypothetical protein
LIGRWAGAAGGSGAAGWEALGIEVVLLFRKPGGGRRWLFDIIKIINIITQSFFCFIFIRISLFNRVSKHK